MKDLYNYDTLIEDFLAKRIPVKIFERTYIDKFTGEEQPLTEELYQPLNWLFSEVDAYTDLPIGPDEDPEAFINEDQLRESAAKVLKEIQALK